MKTIMYHTLTITFDEKTNSIRKYLNAGYEPVGIPIRAADGKRR